METFIWYWDGEFFIPMGVKSRKVQDILFASEMCSSIAEAQRLVKQGGVYWREGGACGVKRKDGGELTTSTLWKFKDSELLCVHGEFTKCPHNWYKVKDPREIPPQGWPVILKVGVSGAYRLMKRTDGLPGFTMWPGYVEFMIPVEFEYYEDGKTYTTMQTTHSWSEIWRL